MQFRDRAHAGRELAQRLAYLRGHHPLVLGLPRGGALIAREVAEALDTTWDVLLVKKIGVPGMPETAMGAVGEGGVLVTNHEIVRAAGVSPVEFTQAANQARAALARRANAYRRAGPPSTVAGRTVVLVDDGVATGATAHAAIRVLRARGAAHVVLAVPVGPVRRLDALAREVDRLICPRPLRWMHAIGNSYADFAQVDDATVSALLDARAAATAGQ